MLKFNNGERFKNAKTIGELKAALSELPDETLIEQGFANSVDLVILHNTDGEHHIAFDDGESN
ncbi:hypothetical protein MACH09_47220 [Vibrio sp. MACH09]|uniref:hypothetical protein n=1 Tax=Vibrio sp. MACH09 TaxID=3025122 RepID=UPI00278E7D8A|nr:hypothetical protein [Vibrio sp. MACH09]GLO64214.1 hypothetical protein MACH09_47220 [Vibrio sp. MACH09]